MTEQIMLDVNYSPEDRLWVFRNQGAITPGGVAVLDLWPASVSVSLAEPEVPVSILVEADEDSAKAQSQVRLLAGDGAARLMAGHDLSASLEGSSVVWEPAVGSRWPVVGRLALVSQLEVYADNGSPWWVAEQVALGESLEVEVRLPLPIEAVRDAGLRIVARPAADLWALSGRAHTINSDGALGPAEVLEALARSLREADGNLAAQIDGLAGKLAHPIDAASARRFDDELTRFGFAAPAPVFLGGGQGRSSWSVSDVVTGSPWVEEGELGVLEVFCLVPGPLVAKSLYGLWARAVRHDTGELVALAAFVESGMREANAESLAVRWSEGECELQASLALPPGCSADDVLVEVTAFPTLAPATEAEMAQGIALRASIDALAAGRIDASDRDELLNNARAAHLNAGNEAEARLLDEIKEQDSDAPLGELDEHE